MKLKKLAEVTMWLPGFAPDDPLPEPRCTAEIIAFPLVSQVHLAVPVIDEGKSSDIAERVVEVAADVPAPKPIRSVWPALDGSLHAMLRGEVGKFEANLSAIAVLSLLDAEKRFPTDDERSILNRYTGWGGLPKAFNPEQDDPAWRARAGSLPDLLGEDYTSAKGSVVNAHYTAVFVIDAIWEAVRRLGFRGGRVLDPSAGTGYFIGAMPKDLAEVSEITAIEIDRLSSRMLSRLYGQHGVRTLTVGFEKARLPKDWFDLVISNVPFGNYQVPDDRNVPYANFLIHDYFFGRALEVTRPGGLVAFITSAGTLDKWEDRARRYMASQARLLGAIRLPSGTFSQIANTDVTTDIVFLQKLGAGEKAADDWISVVEAPYAMCDGSRRLYVSNWYVQNPEMLIGRMGQKSNGYGLSNAAIFDGDICSALRERIARLPEGVHHPRAARNPEPMGKKQRDIRVAAPEFVKPGAFCLTDDGRLAVSEGQELLVIEGTVSTTAAKRIVGMMAIRDAARKLLHVQHLTDDDSRLGSYRMMLNMAYDGFVARHGYLHAKANKLAFKGDPDLPLLLSLENYDPEGGVAEKADVFFRRTVGVVRKVDRCNTPEEALLVSLHERGCVDVALMASLLGQASSAFLPDMADRGLIFQNPETSQWETADAYLAGNVRSKLEMAEVAGEEFVRNVDALKAVVPADLGPGEIDARIGSTWIPARDYAEFLDQLLECEGCTVEFCAEAGAWNIDVSWQGERSVASTQTFGTGRISAGELFVVTLNQMVPTIRDRDPVTDRYFVNTEETIAAREKQQALKEAFGAWVFADPDRCERLVRLYNDQFNSVRLREFDGSGLALPGFSEVFNLHRHQKDAIWRIVSGGVNTLLAHVVGAGKTLTMICGGMELRRLGIASKPCYVVPNHMLEQFAAEFLRAYPGANILMASKDDLVGDKRRTLLSRIATGDWDGVLITHASFERIKMSDEAMTTFIEARVYEIECAIRASKSQKRGNRIVKELERAKKSWLARLEKLAAKSKKDDMLTFEELGVDFLFIDEAHCFPGQTPVLTEFGWLPIGDVVRRRLSTKVASVCIETGALEWKAVTDWVATRTKDPLVRVSYEGGIFECTADHQIWTYEDGYVEAGSLRTDHHLRILRESGQTKASWEACPEVLRSHLREQGHWSQECGADRDDHKNLPAMREGIFVSVSGSGERRQTSVLLESMRGGLEEFAAGSPGAIQAVDCSAPWALEREASSDGESLDAAKQSNEVSGISGENAAVVEWPDLSRKRGEWIAHQATNLVGGHLGSSDGIRNTDDEGEGAVSILAQSLQGGYRRSVEEGGHRGGRKFPQIEDVEVPGQAESRNTERSRVVGVEVLESGCAQEPGSSSAEGQDVYCLEVDGNHNFFAAGVLVSNCFKNLYRFTKMARVAGLPNANSERAFDMFVKTRHVMDKHGGRSGVVFATGTPVSNSMAEMWTMQRYLQPATLRGNHVAQFDTWAGNFGESVTALELSPDGGGYRMNTRFARFVNLPELMTMFREVADIRTADMLKLPVPRFHLETVTAKPTAALKAFVATLVERAEAIRNGTVSPNEDNMLAVTNDGRKAALDMRLVAPREPEAADGKVSLCAERIHGIWRDTTAFRGTQAVFCDLSTPTDDGRFSVYHVIRAKLVEMGVPGTEIAFIHDFESDTAKAELFKAVREGRIRVLLGSTLKMGVGTNIQTRLAALHHLDAPWRPSDVEQREGRIIRQGNLNEEVRIVRYVTEASFDAYIWQTLETKARFIAQVMRGDTGMRSAEDVELAALSYAEVKALASGNPLVMEKAGIDAEVAKLSLLKSQWDNQRWSNQRESATLPGRIEKLRQRIEAIDADIADRVDVRGQRFCMVIDGQHFVERAEAGEALVRYYFEAKARTRKIGNWKMSAGEIVVGQFAGFDLAVSIPTAAADGPSFLLKMRRAYVAHHSDNPIGMVRVIENVANALEGRLAEVHEDLARAEKRLADILAEISKPFDKEDRLTQLLVRQREINTSLDLDKGNAGAMEAETEAA